MGKTANNPVQKKKKKISSHLTYPCLLHMVSVPVFGLFPAIVHLWLSNYVGYKKQKKNVNVLITKLLVKAVLLEIYFGNAS